MPADPSQTPHAGLAPSGVVPGPSTQITSPYLAAAPAGLFAPPQQSALFDPSNQTQPQHAQQQQPPQSTFAHPNGSFQHPSASSQDAVYRVPAVPRSAQLVDYSNSYPQLDSHMQPQQPPHSVPYNQHLYASTSYSALAGPSPVAGFAPELSPHAYTHSDLAMMQQSNMGVPMMRYGSFGMAADDMSRASSSGTPGPMTQQDIDNLLAMSRAQAGTFGDVTAFPCTYCDKVYTGKHARSIWRRHLQDKHNIPLSAQPRRTRWDGDVNRPKNAEERRARMLESKRRWARKKRLQEKQAAMGGTPLPDSDDEGADDGDDSADADVSSMSMSFSRSTNGDDSLSMPQAQAEAQRRASLTGPWDVSPHAQLFASQDGSGRPAKRQALAPSTAHNVAGPSSMPMQFPVQSQAAPFGAQEMGPGGLSYSTSPIRRGGLPLASMPQQGTNLAIPSNANASFSSNSSDYSQPGSASFFNDSFAGNISSAGSDTANTSIDTPATTWPALPPLDGPTDKAAIAQAVEGIASTEAQPRAPKGDTRDAAIQLLALRSGSNSPADDREMSLKRRDAIEDAPWSSTPSRGKVASAHAALNALSCSSTADAGRKSGALDDLALSPSPVSRALASGATSVRAMPVTTPGPANRGGDNPFSLDKHKISPYEGRRKLSYSGAPASPTASPTHLTFGGVNTGKGVAATGATSTAAALGVKLAPLVSTPIRPTSQAPVADDVAERIKADGLPPLLASTKKTAGGAPIMSTPFSKPMTGLGYSALRHGPAAAASTAHMANLASAKRPTPSRHRSDDQFSSPQHLNLTESLGLAPHSISRTSSYASACYGSSLGLTPSVAHMSGGLISGTPFHSGLGALSGLGGFTPLSTAKGAGFWPESTRKAGLLGAGVVGNSPSVYRSSQASARSAGASRPKSRTASPALGKGDIFDADYRKEGPSSDDTFDDDDDENAIGALDTPSRPAAMRGLARTKSAKEHPMGSPAKRSPLRGIRVNQ